MTNCQRLEEAARRLDAAWSVMTGADDDDAAMEDVVAAIGELRAALDGTRRRKQKVGRIHPAVEAGALASEWVDQFLHTDEGRTSEGWGAVYTPEELTAVQAELAALRARLPHPGESLFYQRRYRLRDVSLTRDEYLDSSPDDLPWQKDSLGTLTASRIRGDGIRTIRQLTSRTAEELLDIRLFGYACLEEVRRVLELSGDVHLKGE